MGRPARIQEVGPVYLLVGKLRALPRSLTRNRQAYPRRYDRAEREPVEGREIFIVELQHLSKKPESHLPRSRSRRSGFSSLTTPKMMIQQSSRQCPLYRNLC